MAKLQGTWLQISNEIDAVFKRHNFTRRNFRVSKGGGSEFRLTISGQEATASGEKPKPFAKAAADYKMYLSFVGHLSGFQLSWLDKPFNLGGRTYFLRGYDGAKPKNCIVLERDGRSYKVSPIQVKLAIELSQQTLLDVEGT